MRIAYLAAGAGGMYCGSCLHDNTLAAALLQLGEEVILAPIYTPLRTDEPNVSEPRVFFGGINAYLQQKIPLFRRTPRWVDRWLDHPALLRLATRHAGSVDPAKLGGMTVSMLRAEQGNQRKELVKLVDWLLGEVGPDVVHLSNSMMLGIARMIAERRGPPVICSLSGEDAFLEKIPPPHYHEARELLRERAADVSAFVAMNDYYAGFMAEYLAAPRERVHAIPHGLSLEGHGQRAARNEATPRRVGYLARICHDKGLHLLVEACELLKQRGDVPPFELHAAGYLGGSDRGYFRAIERRAATGPLAGGFRYHGELDRPQKIAFLQSLDVMCTPTVYRESKGIPAIEAMANGVPVVLPRHGAFPEIVASTRGGLLHEPGSSSDLAHTLSELLRNPQRAQSLGDAGRRAVHEDFSSETMARRTRALYRSLLDASAQPPC